MKLIGKKITAFNYYRKTLHLKSLRGFWVSVGIEISQDSDYTRIANISRFSISRVTQGLPIFLNMAEFWTDDGM